MRYLYIALIVFLTAVVLVFKFQNLTSVTISLLGMSATLPVSTLDSRLSAGHRDEAHVSPQSSN
jgi:hypothetical protein